MALAFCSSPSLMSEFTVTVMFAFLMISFTAFARMSSFVTLAFKLLMMSLIFVLSLVDRVGSLSHHWAKCSHAGHNGH